MLSRYFFCFTIGLIFNSITNAQSTSDISYWAASVNSQKNLKELYHQNAVHVNEWGEIINGAEIISSYWVNRGLSTTSSTEIFQTNAVYRDNIVYSIGNFTTNKETEYVHLLVEETSDSDRVRKLEFVSIKEAADIDLSIIDQRRNEWIEYCNAHNAEALVQNLYTENAVYYNHRPVITGRAALTQAYQYMNSPRYSLNLTPHHVEIVNDSIIYEIGQYDGSYNGKYILVWQKDAEGTWSILMDSNI